jgi:hypothetical protein
VLDPLGPVPGRGGVINAGGSDVDAHPLESPFLSPTRETVRRRRLKFNCDQKFTRHGQVKGPPEVTSWMHGVARCPIFIPGTTPPTIFSRGRP